VIFNEVLDWGFETEGPVRTFAIVPGKVCGQLSVEGCRVQKLRCVVIDEFLLDSPVEPFAVCIHLRGLWVGVPVGLVQASDLFVEVLHELTPVVGEDMLDRMRKQLLNRPEELCRRGRGMASCRESKGEPRVEVGAGHDVASRAMDDPLDRVEGEAVTRVGGDELFRLSDSLLPLS